MALNFPDSPTNNQVFTDGTGEQWRYNSADNSWTSLGLTNAAGIIYKGSVDITAAPPAGVQSGWQYTVSTGGTANAGYGPGITGAVVAGSVVLFDGTRWVTTTSAIPSATASVAGIQTKLWKRTGTTLAPETANDALSVDGNVTLGGTGGVFFDATAKRLAVGTTTPDTLTHLYSSTSKTTVGESDIIRLAGHRTDNSVGARLEIGFNYAPTSRKNFATIGYITTDTTSFCKGDLYFATRNVTTDTAPTERARIDSSGRLLVGTSSARANYFNSTFSPLVQFEGANSDGARLQSLTYGRAASSDGPILVLGKFRDNTVGGNTVVASGDQLGWLSFQGSDGTQFVEGASIRAEVDGTPGADDMPGRLVFLTTADGASSPTERMRIKNNGTINFSNVAVYADNIAAKAGGLVDGDVYRTATGQLMIAFT